MFERRRKILRPVLETCGRGGEGENQTSWGYNFRTPPEWATIPWSSRRDAYTRGWSSLTFHIDDVERRRRRRRKIQVADNSWHAPHPITRASRISFPPKLRNPERPARIGNPRVRHASTRTFLSSWSFWITSNNVYLHSRTRWLISRVAEQKSGRRHRSLCRRRI